MAVMANEGFQWPWLVGCNGCEIPFSKNGKTYLYMWNAVENAHYYYCYQDDIFITDKEYHAQNPV